MATSGFGILQETTRIEEKHDVISAWQCIIQSISQNVPLVTRRKCSSTTEYLLSYKSNASSANGGIGLQQVTSVVVGFAFTHAPQKIAKPNSLTKTTYSVPSSSSSRSSPT